MKIRSITFFISPSYEEPEISIQKVGQQAGLIHAIFSSAGYEIESLRLATTPYSDGGMFDKEQDYVQYARKMEKLASDAGFDNLSLGPAQMVHPGSFDAIPQMLEETENVFLSGLAADYHTGLDTAAVWKCAEVIHRCATIRPEGFGNLRFTMLANVSAGAPFFPASYAKGKIPAFAVGTEAADLVIDCFQRAGSLAEAREFLVGEIEERANQLADLGAQASRQIGCSFLGVDFTPAPYPDRQISLGTALEALGVPAVGVSGSLAAATLLAETLNRAKFPKTGFNGLMLPVLEDATLAQRAAEGSLGVEDLLLYSAVCGTGLDCIPLPGDTSVEQLYAILLDVAALALRLNKPLTARLLPVPGKAAGDSTQFRFGYFANTRIMKLKAEPLAGVLAGKETIILNSRWDLLREE